MHFFGAKSIEQTVVTRDLITSQYFINESATKK